MKLYSNNVDFYESLDRFYFDEDFDLRDFSVNFELDDHGYGRVDFEPFKRVAHVFYYADLEDLTPGYYFLGLENSETGRKLVVAANDGNLGKVYRAALDVIRNYFKDRA